MGFIKFLLILHCLKNIAGYVYDPDYLVPPRCPPCDAKSCPQLTFCAGKEVKDHCGCCPRCSSDLFQPHVDVAAARNDTPAAMTVPKEETVSENPCSQRQCPKFKVCMVNVQGLPICTCPSLFVCKRGGKGGREIDFKDTQMCGSDGKTYDSRCHMRIANCNSKKRIKRRHNGICTAQDLQEIQVETLLPSVFASVGNSENQLEENLSGKPNKARKKKRKDGKKRKNKNKNRRKQRKTRAKKRDKKRQRRMKRRNESFQQYLLPPRYEENIKWSSSQVRKSRI